MIVDGFDYGEGHIPTTIICKGLSVWHAESNRWVNSLVTCQAEMNHEIAQNQMKYRRPMTEAEKQAEKAKEEKVSGLVCLIDEDGDSCYVPISEIAKRSQLPEVVAEVERQRKEREIKVGDWVAVSGGPIFKVGAMDGRLLTGGYVSWVKDEFCTKITDPAFIALLEAGAK